MTDKPRFLSRAQAALWFQARGLQHVTPRHLSQLADQGSGPPYSRMGRHTYYTETDLEAWLATAMRPVQRARAKPGSRP